MMFSLSLQAQTVKESYSFAVIGEPKYAVNFDHFDYVNPAAPKGGNVRLAALGTFDNFNRFALRGNAAVRTESLMMPYLPPQTTKQVATIRWSPSTPATPMTIRGLS